MYLEYAVSVEAGMGARIQFKSDNSLCILEASSSIQLKYMEVLEVRAMYDHKEATMSLKQHCCSFYRYNMDVLEKAFMPTLNTVFHAPLTSPLSKVDVRNTAELLTELTSVRHLFNRQPIGDLQVRK